MEVLELNSSTYFNWQNRADNDKLVDRSSRPETSPKTTGKKEIMKALETIFKYPDWGPEKLSQYLTREQICYLSSSTLYRIKKELEKKLNCEDIQINQRYEFIEPNDCWALDFLEFKYKQQKLYLSFILDDKSRYILNWSITTSPTFEFVKNLLSQTFKQYEKPEVIKTDNGPQFRKQFAKQLKEWLINHHPSPVYTPNYNGKVERKNRDFRKIVNEIDDNMSLETLFGTISNFIYEHNHIRPHQSLEGITPYQSYNGFAEEVKAKMKAFKEKELERKGFKQKDKKESETKKPNQKQGTGIPAYLINEPDTVAGFVKSFIEIRL